MNNLKNNMFAVFAPLFVLAPFADSFAEGAESGGSPLTGFAPFVLLFVLFYFLIIRPQQKRSRQRNNMLKGLKRGDNVITNGGIYATITEIGESGTITLEIAKGVTVKATASAVASQAEETSDKKAGG